MQLADVGLSLALQSPPRTSINNLESRSARGSFISSSALSENNGFLITPKGSKTPKAAHFSPNTPPTSTSNIANPISKSPNVFPKSPNNMIPNKSPNNINSVMKASQALNPLSGLNSIRSSGKSRRLSRQFNFVNSTVDSFENTQFAGGKYLFGKKIAFGSFGCVYDGVSTQTAEIVAIKVEEKEEEQLVRENKIYKLLNGCEGFSKIFYFSSLGDFNVMVMEKLGDSLQDKLKQCGNKFSLRTTLLLAEQLITRIQTLHNTNHVHRDIKPENFLTRDREDTIFLIDFGLAKKFCDATGDHFLLTENSLAHGLTGTARYASLNAHYHRDQSRRDDLESIGYMLIYFLLGSLPWQNIPNSNIEEGVRFNDIRDMKKNIDSLFEEVPRPFKLLITYARNLAYEQEPDYDYLLNNFSQLYYSYSFNKNENGEDYHPSFDWDELSSRSFAISDNGPKRVSKSTNLISSNGRRASISSTLSDDATDISHFNLGQTYTLSPKITLDPHFSYPSIENQDISPEKKSFENSQCCTIF